MNHLSKSQNMKPLRPSLIALLLSQFLVLLVFSIELSNVHSSQDIRFLELALLVVRIICCTGLAAATYALWKSHEKSWKWGVGLQLTLIAASLLQVIVVGSYQSFSVFLTFSNIFFQIVALRMFFLRSLVVRYGLERLKPWFRERRIGTRVYCKLKLVGQTSEKQNIDCQLINVSLSGCLFCTNSNLEDGQVVILSPEHASDIVLRVVVKSANHRPALVSQEQVKELLKNFGDSAQSLHYFSGVFEEKLSDQEFNRILREKSRSDLPPQSA